MTINLFDIKERFKKLPKVPSNGLVNFYRNNGFVRLSKLLLPGFVISSVDDNDHKIDARFNQKSLNNSLIQLEKSYSDHLDKVERLLETSGSELKSFAARISLAKETISSSINDQVIFLDFASKQKQVLDNKFTSWDLLSSSSLSNYKASHILGIGYSTALENEATAPIINIFRDRSDSSIGHFEQETTDLDNKYTATYAALFRQPKQIGPHRIKNDSMTLAIWVELGGLQEVNTISWTTPSLSKIISVSILDENENETEISYDRNTDNYNYRLSFSRKICKAIKLKFKLNNSLDRGLVNEIIGDYLSFMLNNIKVSLITNQDVGYVTVPLNTQRTLIGIKIANGFTDRGSYHLDTYLKIERYRNKIKYKEETIPLLEEYDALNTFPLYFLNGVAKLHFYPGPTLTIYENGVALPYTLIDSSGTEFSDVPDPNFNSLDGLSVLITSYNPQSKYEASYRPRRDTLIAGYKFSHQQLILKSVSTTDKLYLQYVIRRLNDSEKSPVLKSSKLVLNYR